MTAISPKWEIHGYAIVCMKDCIADADGQLPDDLHNEADWAYFQAELDEAAAVLVGRKSHEATPNPHQRLRIIMSSRVEALERKEDGWWWNPAAVDLENLLKRVAPSGGKIAVPGGRGPFDYFLVSGFTAFHLSRAEHVAIEDGPTLFSACRSDKSAEDLLYEAGLRASSTSVLDPVGPVSLQIWRPA